MSDRRHDVAGINNSFVDRYLRLEFIEAPSSPPHREFDFASARFTAIFCRPSNPSGTQRRVANQARIGVLFQNLPTDQIKNNSA